MSFTLPDNITDLAAELRALEQDTKKLPDKVRAAMVSAAREIEELRTLAEDVIRDIEAAVNLRISMMASESAHAEQQSRVKATLVQLAERLKAQLSQ